MSDTELNQSSSLTTDISGTSPLSESVPEVRFRKSKNFECRDFLRGNCPLSSAVCKFRHVSQPDVLENVFVPTVNMNPNSGLQLPSMNFPPPGVLPVRVPYPSRAPPPPPPAFPLPPAPTHPPEPPLPPLEPYYSCPPEPKIMKTTFRSDPPPLPEDLCMECEHMKRQNDLLQSKIYELESLLRNEDSIKQGYEMVSSLLVEEVTMLCPNLVNLTQVMAPVPASTPQPMAPYATQLILSGTIQPVPVATQARISAPESMLTYSQPLADPVSVGQYAPVSAPVYATQPQPAYSPYLASTSQPAPLYPAVSTSATSYAPVSVSYATASATTYAPPPAPPGYTYQYQPAGQLAYSPQGPSLASQPVYSYKPTSNV